MAHERAKQAARNNAAWCDAICRAHGRPGELLEDIWINRHETPRFYPNAVTLSETGSAAQLEHVHELVANGIPGEWGVKDSFCTLDLAALGFRVLFDAQWIWRAASVPTPDGDIVGVRWARIHSASDLADWETAWSASADQTDPEQARIFLPSLLVDRNIAVIAAFQNQRIVAGAVGNRALDVAGLSNVFVPAGDAARFAAGCVAAVIDAFPGLPVVGYEAGGELAAARALGFETVGPLRIWVRVNADPTV